MNGLAIIFIVSIAFTAAEWGSVDVRFGVTILGVAFVAFLLGRCRSRRLYRLRQEQVVVDFLGAWRYCPVSSAENVQAACLYDAARQLLDALEREQ